MTITPTELARDGWLPCPECHGKGSAPILSEGAAVVCPDCEGVGHVHPFLSWDEYREQREAMQATQQEGRP